MAYAALVPSGLNVKAAVSPIPIPEQFIQTPFFHCGMWICHVTHSMASMPANHLTGSICLTVHIIIIDV